MRPLVSEMLDFESEAWPTLMQIGHSSFCCQRLEEDAAYWPACDPIELRILRSYRALEDGIGPRMAT